MMGMIITPLLALLMNTQCTVTSVFFDDIPDASGAVWYDGAIHLHDDDNGKIYRIEDGKIVKTYHIVNEVNDLEDIAHYGGFVYLADTGRNDGGDNNYTVYVTKDMEEPYKIEFALPEAYDIESMFVIHKYIYLITKGKHSYMYRITEADGEVKFIGQIMHPKYGTLQFITGADYIGKSQFMVRTYSELYIYDVETLKPVKELPLLPELQGEAVAVTPYGYFTISERSNFYSEYRGCLD